MSLNDPEPEKELPPDRESFGGTLGRITGRFIWLLIPIVLIALILWGVR
jgi:hypothetical protein